MECYIYNLVRTLSRVKCIVTLKLVGNIVMLKPSNVRD